MFVQVENLKLVKFNQFRSTPTSVLKDIRERGWNVKDCSIKELKKELVKNVYKSVDGKNCINQNPRV